MEMEALKFIGMGLGALGAGVAAIGVGLVFNGVTQGIARNPGAEAKIKTMGILGMIFSEFLGLLAFTLGILIMLKVG